MRFHHKKNARCNEGTAMRTSETMLVVSFRREDVERNIAERKIDLEKKFGEVAEKIPDAFCRVFCGQAFCPPNGEGWMWITGISPFERCGKEMVLLARQRQRLAHTGGIIQCSHCREVEARKSGAA